MPTLLRTVFWHLFFQENPTRSQERKFCGFGVHLQLMKKNTWTFLRKSEIVSQATCNLPSGYDLGYPKNVKHLLSRNIITEIGI